MPANIAVGDRVTLSLGGHDRGPYTVTSSTLADDRQIVEIAHSKTHGGRYRCFATHVKIAPKRRRK
jgi:hypothetical protein